ncbi:MAG: DMT family transporter [Acidobacteriia bacterium]|nr:DMT family transporter [Terriglobia bacterium]
MDFIRNGIFMAIVAHGLIGLSLVWDKVLLRKPATQNLVSYVFWMGAMSIFGIILAFFGFKMPAVQIVALAFGAGALQLFAVFFYYEALKRGEASETLAVMGGFSPVATALIAAGLLSRPLGGAGMLGFGLMVAGGFVMFATEKMNYRRLLPPVLIASGSYGLVNVLQKIAFNNTNFVSGYVFFTLGTFAAAMFLLVRRSWREQIFQNTGEAEPRSKILYFANRFFNGLGSFLIFYAISLTSPAIVDAIAAERYVIIFLSALLITKLRPDWIEEEFHGMALFGKLAATLLVAAGLATVGLQGNETSPGA